MGQSGIRRQQWGLQQIVTSDDLSDTSNHLARATIETAWASMMGDAYRQIAAGVSGVVGGFVTDAQAGTLNVIVSPGLALMPHAQNNPATDSPMVWVQSDTSTTIDLTSLVDATFARLVTIEIEPDLGKAISTQNRKKINPTTGQLDLDSFVVVTGGGPIITATAGVASATPVLAPGTPGRIPVAIVKLPSAAAAFADAFVSTLLCRPMLPAAGGRLTSTGLVNGGGLSVGNASGGGGAFANTGIVDIHQARVELLGHQATVMGQAEFVAGINVRTPTGTDPATLIGSAQAVYAYAVPPPWVADYGADVAPRECVARNPAGVSLFATAESIVLGEAGTFVSLSYVNPLSAQVPGMQNALVVFDTVAPSGLSFGPAGTSPARVDNIRGPHPSTVGGTMTLDNTQDPTWGVSQVVGDSVYLGAVSSLGIIPNQFMAQVYRGRGFIRAIDEVVPGGTSYRPIFFSAANTGVLDPLYPGKYPAMQPGDDEVLPLYAERVVISGELQNNGGAGITDLAYKSAYGYGEFQANPAFGPRLFRYGGGILSNSSEFSQGSVQIDRDSTGQAFITANIGGGGSHTTVLQGYEDPILAAR